MGVKELILKVHLDPCNGRQFVWEKPTGKNVFIDNDEPFRGSLKFYIALS